MPIYTLIGDTYNKKKESILNEITNKKRPFFFSIYSTKTHTQRNMPMVSLVNSKRKCQFSVPLFPSVCVCVRG